jgi:PIN domain nuclease of toxin-antitoxin system
MTPACRAVMEEGEVFVSPVTVWEITRKHADGKLPDFFSSWRGGFPDFLAERGYRPLSLEWEAAARAAALPWHHRDPMDRLLIATAMTAGLTILTNDAAFAAYGVPTLW